MGGYLMGSISLESTEASFDQWRAQRSSRAELIPDNLWNMALGLYPQYKRSRICRQLGLSGGQFKQRLDGCRPAFADTGFVLASNNKLKAKPKAHPEVRVVIQSKERTLTLSVGADALLELLPHIGALL